MTRSVATHSEKQFDLTWNWTTVTRNRSLNISALSLIFFSPSSINIFVNLLKRIKTYLRSTMTEQRLTDLAVLSIKSEKTAALDLDEVVSMFFSGKKMNR